MADDVEDRVVAKALALVEETKAALARGTRHYDSKGTLLATPGDILRCLLAEGKVTVVLAEAARGRARIDCEHENAPDGPGTCPDCGMVFVYCHPCSLAGGAHRGIYHAEPPCPGPTSGCDCKECRP